MNSSRNAFIFIWVIGLIYLVHLGFVSSRPEHRCPPVPFGGWPVPNNCAHGMFVNSCGRSSCAKGPGARCETRRFRSIPQGNCGDGMYCHCFRCMGCSLSTYECYENTCVIAMDG